MEYITRADLKKEFFRGRLIGYEEGLFMALTLVEDLGDDLTADSIRQLITEELSEAEDWPRSI